MATTTTNYGWDIPQSTDLVKDGATAIATLGQDIDTSVYTALNGNKSGLVLLNTTSFSAVASQSLNDVFTSSYENYVIVMTASKSSGAHIYFRMRAAGTDATGSNYNFAYILGSNTSITGAAGTLSFGFFSGSQITSDDYFYVNLFRPQLAAKTLAKSLFYQSTNSVGDISTEHTLANSYDGITIYTSGGTMTGTLSIYGYNK